ncbi:MAG: hypothetical protein U9R41_02080 [Candidatus Marinimicrobia bacterium]|nr:hypothetical protein [Candidatus Neomarinimicrobiota bacterium]
MAENKKKSSEIIIFKTADEKISVNVVMENETVWLTQYQMAELFGKARRTIGEHIQNIFLEGELEEKLVRRNFRHTTQHGAMEGKTQENENIWMTQKMMAELYGVSVSAINQHIKKLTDDNEINNSVIKQYLIVQKEGRY